MSQTSAKTSSQTELLRVLADGEHHSGEDLGAMLGISRAAVWKQLAKLEELGVDIESVRGKGYRISGGLDMLDIETVRAGLDNIKVKEHISVFGTVESTNTLAMQHALEKPGDLYVCTAEQQTAGRGRRGKAWQSPWGRNLYVSLVWQFERGASSLEGLSLVVGLALAEAIEMHGVDAVKLKWPNDLLVNGQKLAGVLLEMAGDPEGPVQVVIGFGVNVRLDERTRAAIDQPCVDVSSLMSKPPSRNELLVTCLNRVYEKVAMFERSGFPPFVDAWKARDAYAGKPVELHSVNHITKGLGRGVNERGALLLETDEGLKAFYGGEISVRPA